MKIALPLRPLSTEDPPHSISCGNSSPLRQLLISWAHSGCSHCYRGGSLPVRVSSTQFAFSRITVSSSFFRDLSPSRHLFHLLRFRSLKSFLFCSDQISLWSLRFPERVSLIWEDAVILHTIPMGKEGSLALKIWNEFRIWTRIWLEVQPSARMSTGPRNPFLLWGGQWPFSTSSVLSVRMAGLF